MLLKTSIPQFNGKGHRKAASSVEEKMHFCYDNATKKRRSRRLRSIRKNRKIAEAFRAYGVDVATVEKFIREEMEHDRLAVNQGVAEAEAYRLWQDLPKRDRQMLLNSVFCPNCRLTSFAAGYTIRADQFGLIIEGTCSKCGHRIVRCND